MRIVFTAALLTISVAAAAHETPAGYWGDNTDSKIWHNSYGECWQTGTITQDQAKMGCEPKPVAAPGKAPPPVAAVVAAPAPAPVVAAPVVVAPVDTDGDGVVDANDNCPDSKRLAKVDEAGCYLVLKETVTIAINIKFPTGSSRIDAAGNAEIQKLADFMNQYPQSSVEIGGHTDNRGAAATNRKLSQARADSVRKTLIEKFNIAGDRVSAKGYGPDQPIADNDTPEGRTANRRVEGVVSQIIEKVQQ
ncbi:MAG: OmpA family protein [Pseudomonadota bacterium]